MGAPVQTERRRTPTAIGDLQRILRELPNLDLTPAEMQRIMNLLNNAIRQLQTRQPETSPRTGQPKGTSKEATPRRLTTEVTYTVRFGRNEYEVTLDLPNPNLTEEDARAIRSGRISTGRLRRLLLENSLVETGATTIYARVQMRGRSAEARQFNGREPNARLDEFRDLYLAQARDVAAGGEGSIRISRSKR